MTCGMRQFGSETAPIAGLRLILRQLSKLPTQEENQNKYEAVTTGVIVFDMTFMPDVLAHLIRSVLIGSSRKKLQPQNIYNGWA